jgi:hypothetical protein
MDTVLLVAAGVAALGVFVVLADRALLAMEARGWIYRRKNVRPAEDPPFEVNLDAGTVHIRLTRDDQAG